VHHCVLHRARDDAECDTGVGTAPSAPWRAVSATARRAKAFSAKVETGFAAENVIQQSA
jgi:hypothetical protein